MTSVAVDALEFRPGGPKGGFRLGPVSFTAPSGSRTALVGPSGSGKSTLLRCLAGLETPSAGTIRFGDRVVSGDGAHVPPTERRIGFVFQSGALWPHMTALEHLRFVAPEMKKAEARALLERVGLGGMEKRRPGSLSGGEGQRLALARALAPSPDVLLLDEPLSSVDVHLRDALTLLVRSVSLERGLTLVVVTHDRDEALAMADDLVVLRSGRVVESGAALDLLARPETAFTAAFLAQAACLPVEVGANGSVRTAFGTAPRPDGEGPWSLVLLPGDVACGDGPAGRVLHCEPDGGAFRVHVELDGQTVRLRDANPRAVGEPVSLRLQGAPRLLPAVDEAKESS